MDRTEYRPNIHSKIDIAVDNDTDDVVTCSSFSKCRSLLQFITDNKVMLTETFNALKKSNILK